MQNPEQRGSDGPIPRFHLNPGRHSRQNRDFACGFSEISSDKINSSDQDALSSALQNIDGSMRSSRSSSKPSPEEGKATTSTASALFH